MVAALAEAASALRGGLAGPGRIAFAAVLAPDGARRPTATKLARAAGCSELAFLDDYAQMSRQPRRSSSEPATRSRAGAGPVRPGRAGGPIDGGCSSGPSHGRAGPVPPEKRPRRPLPQRQRHPGRGRWPCYGTFTGESSTDAKRRDLKAFAATPGRACTATRRCCWPPPSWPSRCRSAVGDAEPRVSAGKPSRSPRRRGRPHLSRRGTPTCPSTRLPASTFSTDAPRHVCVGAPRGASTDPDA